MNRRLEAIDSGVLIVVCLQKALNNFRFQVHYSLCDFFVMSIYEFVQEDRVLYLDCDMIFTEDLSTHFWSESGPDLVLER